MGGEKGSVRDELYGRQMRGWGEEREGCRDELYGRQMRGWGGCRDELRGWRGEGGVML